MRMAKTKVYRASPIAALGSALIIMLWINFAVSLGSAGLAFIDWRLASSLPPETLLGVYGEVPGFPIMDITGMLRLVVILVAVVAGIVSLQWIYRANMNAQAWSPAMRVSPFWSVAWFFIPVAFLWKPFQGVSDTWDVSHGSIRTPALLRWWWAVWLISNFTGQISFRLGMRAETTGMLAMSFLAEALSAITATASVLTFLWIVQAVTAAQTRRMTTPPSPSDHL